LKHLLTQEKTTIINVKPNFADPLIPAKATLEEIFPIKASIFQEGRNKSDAKVIFENIFQIIIIGNLIKELI